MPSSGRKAGGERVRYQDQCQYLGDGACVGEDR